MLLPFQSTPLRASTPAFTSSSARQAVANHSLCSYTCSVLCSYIYTSLIACFAFTGFVELDALHTLYVVQPP